MKKIFLFLSLMALSGAAAAAPDLTSGMLDTIVQTFRDAAAVWGPIFKKHTLWLFWTLVAIEFTWGAIKLATGNSEFDSIVAFLFNQIMMIGLFLAFITKGAEWATALVDSFRMAAADASKVTSISPSGVMDLGLDLSIKIASANGGSGISGIPFNLFLMIMGAFVMGIFCLIVAELVFVLVSMWIAVYAGLFMLGFGGLSFTRFLAENYWKTVLGLAIKLFMIQLLIGISTIIMDGWVTELNKMEDPSYKIVFVIAGVVLVLHRLITNIGGIADSFISGAGAASTNGGGMAGTAAAVGMGAAAATIGGAQVGKAAIKDAVASSGGSAAIQAARAGSLGSGLGAAGNMVAKGFGSAMKTAATAAMQEGVKGITGQGDKGSFSSRVASNMQGQTAEKSASSALNDSKGKGGGGDKAPTSPSSSNYISGVDS